MEISTEQVGESVEETLSRPTISTVLAGRLIEAAQNKAQELGVPAVIAVLDESGIVKAISRMDGAPLLSIQIAQDKAYSAVGTGFPTHMWYEITQGDPAFALGVSAGIDRLCTLGGGYPIAFRGSTIGGLGVSGGTYAQDMEIATAALSIID